MKLSIKTEELLTSLSAHHVLTKNKGEIKILDCCRLFADDEGFGFGNVLNIDSVSSLRDSVSCRTKSICNIEEEGAAFVNCEELYKEDCLKIFTTDNFAKYSCSEDVEYEVMRNNDAGIIGFDYKFFLNAIEKMDRYIFIYALDEDTPIIIENSSCDGCVQVLMPKQI